MSPTDAERLDAHQSQEYGAGKVVEKSHETGSDGGGMREHGLDRRLEEERNRRGLEYGWRQEREMRNETNMERDS